MPMSLLGRFNQAAYSSASTCGQRLKIVEQELPSHRQHPGVHQNLSAPFSIAFRDHRHLHGILPGGAGFGTASNDVRSARQLVDVEMNYLPLQRIAYPPSTKIVAPVTKSDACEARKIAAPPHSAGVPNLPAGVRIRISL